IDRRIGEDRIEAVGELDAVLGADRLGMGARAVMPGGEADRAALALHRADQRAAPPPDPDDRRTNHGLPPAPEFYRAVLHIVRSGGHAGGERSAARAAAS